MHLGFHLMIFVFLSRNRDSSYFDSLYTHYIFIESVLPDGFQPKYAREGHTSRSQNYRNRHPIAWA